MLNHCFETIAAKPAPGRLKSHVGPWPWRPRPPFGGRAPRRQLDMGPGLQDGHNHHDGRTGMGRCFFIQNSFPCSCGFVCFGVLNVLFGVAMACQ